MKAKLTPLPLTSPVNLISAHTGLVPPAPPAHNSVDV